MENTGIYAYLRLSRDEEKERGVSMEAKIQLRREILITIARHHNLTLPPENIVVELKSAGSLHDREGLLGLLDKCRSREIHTLICFDIDRLTRDVADLKIIMNAFYKGEVKLITQRGAETFDRNHDSAMMQILAVLGEKERRSFSYRRKATNAQRARNGQLSSSNAAYGYKWNRDAKEFSINPLEYPILEEIFQRAWREGANSIARDLNLRGVTPPGVGRKEVCAAKWLPGVILHMLHNPFYTGHTVRRSESDRDGLTSFLPPAQWIWAEKEAEWPHPIGREAWHELMEVIAGRVVGKPATSGLLTGLLYCAEGERMSRRLSHYTCLCADKNKPHRGMHVKRERLDALICAALAARVDALPALPTPAAPPLPIDALMSQLRSARAALREKKGTLSDLMARAGFYVGLPSVGPEGHARMMEGIDKEIGELEGRISELESKLMDCEKTQIAPLLTQIRQAGGMETFFSAAPLPLRREAIRRLVVDIRLLPFQPGRGMTEGVTITYRPLIEGEGEQTETIPIPHPRLGQKRGPYAWKAKAGEKADDGEN